MRAPDSAPAVLATQYWNHPELDSNPAYGAWVAIEGYFLALLRHGSWDHYDFYVNPSQRASARTLFRDMPAGRARMRELSDVRASDGKVDVTAWMSPDIQPSLPGYLRDVSSSRPFPITMVHHTFSYQNFLHQRLLPLILADMLPCDSLVCTSAAARRSLEILLGRIADRFNERHGTNVRYRGRFDTVPLGVDTEILAPRNQAVARRELNLPLEPIVVLWLGRISAVDKADLMPVLLAFSDVAQYQRVLAGDDGRPLMLVVAGADSGGQQATLEQAAAQLGIGDSLRVFTRVDAFRRSAFYNAADVFVAPTDNIQETFGITPIEAMACGVPQIVSDWDGYRDTVADGETGLRVPTLWMKADEDLIDDPLGWQDRTDHAALAQSVAVDPTQLRSALTTLVLNDDLRARMAVASRTRAEQVFAWPRIVARMEELWAELEAVARGLSAITPPGPDYQQPFFFDAFSHYATTILTEDQRIRRSPLGTKALDDTGDLAPPYGDMDPKVMRRALNLLEDEMPIGELRRRLQDDVDPRPVDAAARRQIMRLIKYGYAHLA